MIYMSTLDEARIKIEEIDKEMARLFEERMACAKSIAGYKMEHGLPILDESREKALLSRNVEYMESDELRPYYTSYLQAVMDVSKRYQKRLSEGVRVAYSGIEGSFAYIASSHLFPEGALVSYKSFKEAYDAVVSGECDLAVLPIENSFAGEVGQVTDLMFSGSLYINRVYPLRVSQNLLGVPGTTVDGVKKVISHPQALEQCAEYIEAHGYEIEQATNTARAAKAVADAGDKTVAAIASKETATLYELTVLDHDINKDQTNTTRFAVFSKSRETIINAQDYSTFILMFTVKNQAGTLAEAIGIIGKHGYSMRVLRSRPLRTSAWQYYFYVEVEGKLTSEQGEKMLSELSGYCESLKIVGSYSVN